MGKNPNTGNDFEKLDALYRLQILDTAPEKEFDNIAALAAQICGTPIATIGFADNERFWFKARYGANDDFSEIPGGLSICKKVYNNEGVFVVEDTTKHEYFSTNEVIIQYNIRFIASAELLDGEGCALGHLCIFDHKPRTLSSMQKSAMTMLAGQVTALLKLRLELLSKKANEYSAAEAQMKTIFRNAIDGVVVTDDTGQILQWNPKAEEIFGWTEAEVWGKKFHDVCLPVPETKIEELRSDPSRLFNGQILSKSIDLTAKRKGDVIFEAALGISPTEIDDRTYYIYFISDITERRQTTKDLDKQKAFYENILNNIPTDIAVFDANHKYRFVNPGAIRDEKFRRYIIGKDDFEYSEYRKRDKSLAQVRRDKFLEAKNTGKEIRWEDSLIGPSGHLITHLRRMFPVHDENGNLTMMIGFGIDITERKEMEERQSALLQQLSVQNTQLIDFCNIVSHNLRAPLVNMSMLVDFIEDCGEIEEQKQLIAKLNPVLDNLSTTFNELVESIQIKQDLEIKSEKIVLEEYFARTIESLDAEIIKSNATFEVNFDEAPEIYYPAKYLNSILQNLISNSLKYKSPNRDPIIRLKTKVTKDKVILSVNDNGLGIDMMRHKKNMFKIGKVFHHHPNAKGFGLFMIKTHIEAMGGRIWVESAPNKGSTFFVEFENQH
jgi:PAS domain S-box-containing protein